MDENEKPDGIDMKFKFPWIEKYRTGYIPNAYDPRDYDFASSQMIHYGALPLTVDLFGLVHEVLYQGNAPSCVACAIAHQILIEEKFVSVRETIPSRAYIYALARAYHQGANNLHLAGTYPRLAYKGVQKLGCPPEQIWPYSTKHNVLNRFPTDAARRNAFGRFGLQYYTIQRNRSARIRQALAGGHPVCFGTQITERFKKADTDYIHRRPEAGDLILGGHYMCIVGYKLDYFIVLNSWKGKERYLIDEDYIEWSQSGDFTVITGWNDIKGKRL